MRIPKYWIRSGFLGVDTRGEPAEFIAWGWSSHSELEAKQLAERRAKAIFLHLSAQSEATSTPTKAEEYDYLNNPPREEIIETFGDPFAEKEVPAGQAIISRNRYGALVLNTAGILFVDIDLGPLRSLGLFEYIQTRFSSARREAHRFEPHQSIINRIENWSFANPSTAFRLYQTRAGYRLLFTAKHHQPTSEETVRIFKSLQCDPLYQRLTAKQNCFRARLTPKPWRLGLSRPPDLYPRDSGDQRAFNQWLSQYESASSRHATCKLVRTFGPSTIDARIRPFVELHDRHTKADSNLSLA